MEKEKLLGKYRHFKSGKTYEVIEIAMDPDTLDKFVIYRPFEEYKTVVYTRSFNNFFEQIETESGKVPRFEKIKPLPDISMLFLDDSEARIRQFEQKMIGKGIYHVARTAEEAINALKSFKYITVSLDHDLGDTQMAPSDEKSGYAVAKFISEMEDPPALVMIHSFNPEGAKNMQHVLQDSNIRMSVRTLFGAKDYWYALGIYD